jgi:hypothetical protein
VRPLEAADEPITADCHGGFMFPLDARCAAADPDVKCP